MCGIDDAELDVLHHYMWGDVRHVWVCQAASMRSHVWHVW